ncbi:protoporphyrinogen/coproporphyrinogen oxidase [Streptomyces iconiensis]|uniref:NAD(P)-binding protein n=1 Tax=Streptomyces iconiensis TaxID=1384038 RepID=A0ABT6ZZG3_9ACTN|nr:NAD(P)-binding protein [Streptomyces iconiensis]MDJ1134467.1 NAD(P)-binding protein [Streptomyces iconiensis]
MRTVIVGAGPAGLGVAHALGAARTPARDCVLLEREAEPAGLCRSFTVGGATFDYGGHAFFTKHPEVDELLGRLAPHGLYRQPRNAWVHSHGTYVPYPFQSNLFGLPVDVVADCLLGATRQAAVPAGAPPAHLAEWVTASFGEGIARHFLTPYNSKLWAHPLDMVTPHWTGERIVQPDLDDIVRGALSRREYRKYPNAQVRYPARGGFSELYRPLGEALGDRIRHDELDRLDLARRTAHTRSGATLEFDTLVATLPLPDLVARTADASDEIRDLVGLLRYNSLHLVSLAVDPANATDKHRVYAADPEIPFHKLVLNNNSSPALSAAPAFGIQAEVSFSPYKPVAREGLVDRVVGALVAMGLLRTPGDVRAADVREIPYAYPVATADTARVVTALREFYGRHGVLLAGRFGEWAYINSDSALQRGLDIGKELAR